MFFCIILHNRLFLSGNNIIFAISETIILAIVKKRQLHDQAKRIKFSSQNF